MKLITTPRLAAVALAATTLGLAACNDPADAPKGRVIAEGTVIVD